MRSCLIVHSPLTGTRNRQWWVAFSPVRLEAREAAEAMGRDWGLTQERPCSLPTKPDRCSIYNSGMWHFIPWFGVAGVWLVMVLTAHHAIMCKWPALEPPWVAKGTIGFLCNLLETPPLTQLAGLQVQELRVSEMWFSEVRTSEGNRLQDRSVLFSSPGCQLQPPFHLNSIFHWPTMGWDPGLYRGELWSGFHWMKRFLGFSKTCQAVKELSLSRFYLQTRERMNEWICQLDKCLLALFLDRLIALGKWSYWLVTHTFLIWTSLSANVWCV